MYSCTATLALATMEGRMEGRGRRTERKEEVYLSAYHLQFLEMKPRLAVVIAIKNLLLGHKVSLSKKKAVLGLIMQLASKSH